MAQALYRKWRSQSFDDLIGQQHITETLQNAIASNRVAHAYLFTGPRGTGKTSTARILAKAVNCLGDGEKPCNQCHICQAVTEGRLMDLIEIDAASNTSVDDIRDLRDKVGFKPSEAKTKFYIIDEVHMLSKSAFNALLKTLEEPPPHVIFVLATTEPEKIPATIKSRCQRFDFRRIKVEDIAGRLAFILEQEGLRADADALTFIAHQAGGSMRDAISLLDQLTAYGQDAISLDLVQSVLGAASNIATADVVEKLLANDTAGGLMLINKIIGDGIEPRQFTLEILEYLRGLMLIKYGDAQQFLNLSSEMVGAMQAQAETVDPKRLLFVTQRFNQAIKDFRLGVGSVSIPHLPLELAFAEASMEMPQAQSAVVTAPKTTRVVASPPPKVTVAQKSSPPQTTPSSTEESAKPTEPISALTKEILRKNWTAILDEVRQQGGQDRYLKKPMVRDVDIQGDTIIVLFEESYEMALGRAEKSKSIIVGAFQTILGKKWGVQFKVAAESSEDILLKTALEDLGGQIKKTE